MLFTLRTVLHITIMVKLASQKLLACSVPKSLTDKHKWNRVASAQTFLERFEGAKFWSESIIWVRCTFLMAMRCKMLRKFHCGKGVQYWYIKHIARLQKCINPEGNYVEKQRHIPTLFFKYINYWIVVSCVINLYFSKTYHI